VPYFAIALLPGAVASAPPTDDAVGRGVGEVAVVGTGPAGRDWTTPQVAAVLAAADDLVGYGPYLDRVPPNPRQTRYPSDNRVEAERACARARPRRGGPPGRGGVRGRPRGVRDGRRRAGGGRPAQVRRRRRAGAAGCDRVERGGRRPQAPRSGTTTR
jgi:hypothetical protein